VVFLNYRAHNSNPIYQRSYGAGPREAVQPNRLDEVAEMKGCAVPLLFLMGLFIPMWPVSLPICWGFAFLIMCTRGKK
jgi:hypothetical protein